MSSPVQRLSKRQFRQGLVICTLAAASLGISTRAIANPLPNVLNNIVDLFTETAPATVNSPQSTPEATTTPPSSEPASTAEPQSGPASSSTTTTTTPTDTSPRFACRVLDGVYTVVYYPPSQPGEFYAWATPTELGGGWTPQARCNEISRRLESYRPDGLLEMQNGIENGYDTVCVTTQADASCRIVLTVPPGQDPVLTRNRVFENLAVADTGMQTSAVTTFTSSEQNAIVDELGNLLNVDLGNLSRGSRPNARGPRGAINLRPFLDPMDGGTGRMLRN